MIEFLKLENLHETMDLLPKMHASSSWDRFEIDHDYMLKNMSAMIGKDDCFACLYRVDGKVIGLFLASIGQFFFSKKLLGVESGMYVLPEHRGGRAAISMYNEFIKWCDKMGAEPFVEIFFSDEQTNEKTYQFFRKVGLKDCGKMFRRA